MEPVLFILNIIPILMQGLAMTLQISVVSFIAGFALAVVLAPAATLAPSPLPLIARGYIEAFRGTPLLVQLLLIYFGLPAIGVKLDAYTACVLAIGLNSAAYQAEILRGAMKSIPQTQVLSAESLGFNMAQTYRHVILPQALRFATPPLVNEFVVLVKESSLASVIGVVELTRRGEYLVAYTFRALEVYIAVALIYLAVCGLAAQATRLLERKFRIPGYEGGAA